VSVAQTWKLPRVARVSELADVGGNTSRGYCRAFAASLPGIGTTYEQLTGDLRIVNYSSIRAGLLKFRRWARWFSTTSLSGSFCRRSRSDGFDLAVASGALNIADYADQPCEIHGHPLAAAENGIGSIR